MRLMKREMRYVDTLYSKNKKCVQFGNSEGHNLHTGLQGTSCIIVHELSYHAKTVQVLHIPVARELPRNVMNEVRVSSKVWILTPGLMDLPSSNGTPSYGISKPYKFNTHERNLQRLGTTMYNVQYGVQRWSIVSRNGWRQDVQTGKHLQAVGQRA
jgi:hypothetical protein